MSPEPRPSAKALQAADELLAKTLPAWTNILEEYSAWCNVQAMKGIDLHPLEMPIDLVSLLNQQPIENLRALVTVALWHERRLILAGVDKQKGSEHGVTKPQSS